MPALVDVVAEVQDHVGLVARGVRPQRPVARLPVLAAGEQEPHAVARPAGGGCRAGAADGADLVADDEAVGVPPAGPQPVGVDVDRVGPAGLGDGDALADDLVEPVVLGHLPPHGHVIRRHPAARRAGPGRAGSTARRRRAGDRPTPRRGRTARRAGSAGSGGGVARRPGPRRRSRARRPLRPGRPARNRRRVVSPARCLAPGRSSALVMDPLLCPSAMSAGPIVARAVDGTLTVGAGRWSRYRRAARAIGYGAGRLRGDPPGVSSAVGARVNAREVLPPCGAR